MNEEKKKIFPSRSGKANAHDSAVMESFFGLLKREID